MKRVLVTGAAGLVGSELRPLLEGRGAEVIAGCLPECDVSSPEGLRAFLGDRRPDWIVNLAAFTDVDGCEREEAAARAVNAGGAGNVAALAAETGAVLLQVSTDYVFDGSGTEPHAEDDPVNPLSAYGRTKLEGERAVRGALPEDRRLVVRGQSLYGRGRKSFPDAILRAAAERPEIPVVTDQVVAPTWARDFARGLVLLMERGARGTVHLSASGRCTWNAFARAVLEEAGERRARVTETTAAALGRPAPRPAFSVFRLERYTALAGETPRPWREQIRDYLRDTGRAA